MLLQMLIFLQLLVNGMLLLFQLLLIQLIQFFSNPWDNNASIISGGTALFNVSILNTNGTVLLSINGTNYTATNLTVNMYNVTLTGLLNGTYSYNWSSYGSGSSHLFNISNTRNYTVNDESVLYQLSSCRSINSPWSLYSYSKPDWSTSFLLLGALILLLQMLSWIVRTIIF